MSTPEPPFSQRIKGFYTSQVRQEWRRLIQDPYHRLEFNTTQHFLERYLPPTGLILDAGGGPGRYTVALAQQGYDLTLFDLTPANLEFARKRIQRLGLKSRVKGLVEGSITNLINFEEARFDAVICLGGPLSHVLDASQRERAIAELVRVAKPGAPIFVSVMSRLSLLVVELIMFQHEIGMKHFFSIRDTGDYEGEEGFTTCHFFLPEEFRQAFENKGVTILEMAGLEGISSRHRRLVNKLAKDPQRWQAWMETHFLTCTHPSVVGTSEHMLIVCQKD